VVAPAFREESSSETPGAPAVERALHRIARRHGARLLRLADGSVVLTVAGGTVATDLASRAGRAAIELCEELPHAGMALATGMSESGDVATVGDVIDRATDALSRSDAHRARGDGVRSPIALDDVSAALLEHRFVVGRVADVPVLVRPRDGVDAPRQLLGRPTVFVGRDREMATLEGLFRECAAEPVARAVVVTGEPGSGKTRLRHELVERVTRASPSLELLEGAGDPLSAGSAFASIAGLLRRRFGLHAGEPPSASTCASRPS
jgi:xanthine/CO dehydrogenase XdhC/CoxF family maturation factor